MSDISGRLIGKRAKVALFLVMHVWLAKFVKKDSGATESQIRNGD